MSSEPKASGGPSAIEKMAAFIVDKRKAFYLLYIGLAIFCVFSMGWVHVNNDITTYLPEETETRQGLTIMADEFTTFGTNRIMVDNIAYDQAAGLQTRLEKISGVKSVEFDDTEKHYQNGAALFTVTYDGAAEDAVSLNALAQIRDHLDGYDTYVTGDTGDSSSDAIASEMKVVMVIAVVIILLVLLFTSQTYMEIPVLLLTFINAAMLNMGTNYIFGTISFVSNSIAVVLQLALAIDYAIILCHRYTEERLTQEPREAVIAALSKAIPEISGSSLTTLSGLAAMMFMHFRIGYDMGIVLIKAIILSLLSVFTLMPGLLMSFSGLIDKTHHKNFVPKITAWGHFTVKTRFIMPPIFVVLLIAGFILSNKCPYVYGYSTLTTATKNASQIAEETVNATFGSTNTLAVLVPAGDYEKEGALIRDFTAMSEVDSALGLANIEAMDGYVLTDRLTPRQFAELADLDIELSRLLYSAYAVNQETYGKLVSGVDNYSVPLVDMFMFVYDQMQEGYITLEPDLAEKITDLHSQLSDAEAQLKGKDYSRIVLQLTLPEESQETFDFLTTLHDNAAKYYPDGVLLVGNSTSDYDLSSSFHADNTLISILTIVFVILVLVFTFKSAGLPVLLILVIQGSIWINFSFPYLTHTNLFFLSYLIVSSIQMGANIDYAIVITNRYTQLKTMLPLKDAIVETLNQSFPTIVTSGTILASAGILIGQLSSDPAISSIGVCLGRGTILSIALVMAILPQILLLGDVIIEKTAFTMKHRGVLQSHTGAMHLSGHVRGYVSGVVDAEFTGTLVGSINANLEAGGVHPLTPEALPEPTVPAEGSVATEADGKEEVLHA
ncbi:MAG: MMPL family transporter [Oscillibacter sp.]|jgi:predicted RND superfamily exporter protein|nr:MMPL family transporter [Oscillibacter sp.]